MKQWKKTTSSITFLLPDHCWRRRPRWKLAWWKMTRPSNYDAQRWQTKRYRWIDRARANGSNLISDLTRQKMKAAGDWIKINRPSFLPNIVLSPVKFAYLVKRWWANDIRVVNHSFEAIRIYIYIYIKWYIWVSGQNKSLFFSFPSRIIRIIYFQDGRQFLTIVFLRRWLRESSDMIL